MAVPSTTNYFISGQNKQLIKAIMEKRKKTNQSVNILITGKHGLGKSELARQISAHYGLEYTCISVGDLQEVGQLLGYDALVNGETKFVASDFTIAIQRPNQLIHLEELNRPASPKELNELFSLLDSSRSILHDKLGLIKVHEGTVFVASINEGFEYSGIDPLDAALRDRFYSIELGYLPPEVETSLLVSRLGNLSSVADKVKQVLEIVNNLRLNTKDPIHVSTRRMLMIAELLQYGISVKTALVSCIAMDKDKLESTLLSIDMTNGRGVNSNANESSNYELL